ncbi:MAG: TonB-dependent receptor [Bacteroidetes bacterium]|nr:TonB-dependent receptor [Bacteroidota bacterium]
MKLYWLVSLIFFCLSSEAQTSITGDVIDFNTTSGIEYAIITAIDRTTGKVVDGTRADSTGVYTINQLPYGVYNVSIDFVGYEKYYIDSVVLSKTKSHIALKTVMLHSQTHNLNDVVVTGNASVIENRIDKIVYNSANDITTQGGVALDVLKKVPQVSVDVDGNVELQGNSNIRFLINGKPSSIFGNSLADALASIPASQIKSIEAITTPGAKYDAQGTGGIINIILKDNKAKGINGNINLSIGTRIENASVNLNMRNGNFGINAFFSGNTALAAKSPNTQNRTSYSAADQTSTKFFQDGYGNVTRNGYQSGIGFDWDFSKKDAVTGSFQYDHFGNRRDGIANQEAIITNASNNPISDVVSLRNSASQTITYSLDWSINYKHAFKRKGEELNILYASSYGRPTSQNSQNQTYSLSATPYAGTTSYNPGTDKQTNIYMDYVREQGENTTIEAGVKTTFQKIHSGASVDVYYPLTDEYLNDPLQSYDLYYNMNVYAGYLAGSFFFLNFLQIKAGFRIEHTDVNIDYGNLRIPSYNTYVPSVIFSHNLNDKQSIKLAYTHRIERPEYDELNPFLNLSDPYNITTGNPLLKPEIGNNFELGYNRSFKKGGNLSLALSERINSNDIKPYTAFYPTYIIGDSAYKNVSIVSRQNIGTEYNTGFIISGLAPLFDKLNIRGNCMIFNRHIINSFDTTNTITNSFNWRLNMNIGYEISGNFIAEAFVNYRSAFNNIQGRNPQSLTYTFGFRKQFWNKKASIGGTATNLFSNYIKQVTTVDTGNYQSYSVRKIPLRSIGVTFTYKFGRLDFKNKEHNLQDPGASSD